MPNNINPAEVSKVLLDQLKSLNNDVKLEEVGTVLQISDGVARIYGLLNATASELLEFEDGTIGVVMNLEEDNVGAVLLGSYEGIKEGQTVKRTGRIASIDVCDGMLGRVVNPLGVPIDGGPAIEGEKLRMPIDRKAPGVIYRQPVNQALQTGLKAIDSMIPIGRGQRELIIGDRQTGKTAIAIDTIINQRENYEKGDPVYCIYVAIGQKASTVANIVQVLKEHGAMPYTIVVAATAGCTAVLCTICRCCNRRIFPRSWKARPCRIRRFVKAGCCLPRNIPHIASSFWTRGLPGRCILPAFTPFGACRKNQRPDRSGTNDERPARVYERQSRGWWFLNRATYYRNASRRCIGLYTYERYFYYRRTDLP